MKKITLLVFVCVTFLASSYAGGILTNTNQGARYVRLLGLNATRTIDGVYYNPAGLAKLSSGWHFSLSNQSIFQNLDVYSNYPYLSDKESDGYKKYAGTATAPIYPNFHAAYKKNKFAISFGFNIVGGGGTAKMDKGIPSFEIPISNIPVMLSNTPLDPTGTMFIDTKNYQADMSFEGSSAFYGTQVGFSYEITECISASVGLRYVFAKNHYEGSIKNIMINPNNPVIGSFIGMPLDGRYTNASNFFSTLANSPIVSPNDKPLLEAYAAQTGDKYVDVDQSGNGFTPILGANISLMEDRLNFGITYEFLTKLVLENETTTDDTGQYPDGAKINKDIPALLRIGGMYSICESLRFNLGYNLYFDKDVNWDGLEKEIEHNLYEIITGLEYDINEKLLVSAGYQHANTGASPDYHTSLSYSLNSNTIGLGAEYKINEKLSVNVGGLFAKYDPTDKETAAAGTTPAYTTRFEKQGIVFAIGFDFHL